MVTEMTVGWTGPGGPGSSTFHFANVDGPGQAQALSGELESFFNTLADYLPNEVQNQGPTEARVLDVATGGLIAVYSAGPGWISTGQSTSPYNRAAGARVDWLTGTIVGGRRLRGRTYVVPLTQSSFTSDGTIAGSVGGAIAQAAADLVNGAAAVGPNLAVWSRTAGEAAPVTGVTVPSLGAVLRSRRD